LLIYRSLAGVLAFIFASALLTEVIGIHAIFGAFLAGVVMPRDENLRTLLREQFEAVSTVFLLPLLSLFAYLKRRHTVQ
jgi:Kef-type K+ transport system membrane component KefB